MARECPVGDVAAEDLAEALLVGSRHVRCRWLGVKFCTVGLASAEPGSPGSPGEGGSILLLQQWEHDAIGWEALPVAAQEDIIGMMATLGNGRLEIVRDAGHLPQIEQPVATFALIDAYLRDRENRQTS